MQLLIHALIAMASNRGLYSDYVSITSGLNHTWQWRDCSSWNNYFELMHFRIIMIKHTSFKHFILLDCLFNTQRWCYLAPAIDMGLHHSLTICFHLTHSGLDKMAPISQTTNSNAFSWIKMLEIRLIFHWSLFLAVESTILHHWFRLRLGADQATSQYLNQWWLDYRRIYASLGLNELTDAMCTILGSISFGNKQGPLIFM